jgi:hypothetical protein
MGYPIKGCGVVAIHTRLVDLARDLVFGRTFVRIMHKKAVKGGIRRQSCGG